MPTQIEQDAWLILKALAEWTEKEDDLDIGRYRVSGSELLNKIGIFVILPNRINDAVEFLLNQGYVERSQTMGTQPFVFNQVWLEPEGRLEYQKIQEASRKREAQQPNDFKHYVFLSHSSLDDALANDVKQLLDENGIPTFSTPTSIPTGKWQPQIEEALQDVYTIWVLLTPNALQESVWVHHEFGYFYGYNHGKGLDLQGHCCRFLYTPGTERKGLYEHIQGTEIGSFDDPVLVAAAIAKELGKELQVPGDWEK